MSLPSAVYAHVFLQPYTLPVPFWLYLYAAAATLILSFAIIGMFVGTLPAPGCLARRTSCRKHSRRKPHGRGSCGCSASSVSGVLC